MDAKAIAEIVGTEPEGWWPRLVLFNPVGTTLRWTEPLDERNSRAVSDDIAELAFIGAAVKWLRQKWGAVTLDEWTGGFFAHEPGDPQSAIDAPDAPSELAALVQAIRAVQP